MNAPTTRVSKYATAFSEMYIDNGDVTVIASEVLPELVEKMDRETGEISIEVSPGYWTLSWHRGEMPAYAVDVFDSLQELANAMREYRDLRTWRVG